MRHRRRATHVAHRQIDYFVYRAGPGKPSLDLIPRPFPEAFTPNRKQADWRLTLFQLQWRQRLRAALPRGLPCPAGEAPPRVRDRCVLVQDPGLGLQSGHNNPMTVRW
jgi:hypothetical protein